MDQNNNKPQFINFRGQDERLKLLPHLKHHLKGSNVTVFTDDDAIGEPLENLYKYIRRSRIVMVIFSTNYLTSEWCLKELVEIRKCLMTEKVDYAIPIFYNVRASHVKHLTGDFGEKFLALQNKFPESIKKWTKSLIFVAKYVGLSYDKNGSITELDFFRRVVERVDLVLTKITSKEGPNNHNNSNSSSSILAKTSQGEESNLNKFDIYDINRLYHFSKTLEALDLHRQKQNLEHYNRGVYLSRNYPYYYDEPSWILDNNVPQDWPHYDHNRTNSSPDSIYQVYPPLDGTITVQNHQSIPQMSIENFPQAVVQNHPVVTQVGIDTNLQDTLVQNPGVTQSRNDNILQDEMIEVQSPDATQVSNDNAKRNEDMSCSVFVWHCFKLWLYRRCWV